jgi:hypothetical protein
MREGVRLRRGQDPPGGPAGVSLGHQVLKIRRYRRRFAEQDRRRDAMETTSEARGRARAGPGQGPSGGPPLATKFEDYTVLKLCSPHTVLTGL